MDCSLLAEETTIRSIIHDLRKDRAGIISPPVHPSQARHCRWKKNFTHGQKIAEMLGLTVVNDNQTFAFPAGRMFWTRSDVRPLLDLVLPQDYLPEKASQTDGTPAHAVERLYGDRGAGAQGHPRSGTCQKGTATSRKVSFR